MKNLPLIFAIGVGVFLFSNRKSNSTKREELLTWATGDQSTIEVFGQMTEQEINIVHDYIFNYVLRQRSVPPGSRLAAQLIVIGNKYNVFT